MVAYIKTQLGIATQASVIKVKSLLLKLEIQFLLNNLSLLWPIDTKLAVYVAYIKTQLVIATHVYVIKVTVTKIEIQFLLNNFSLLLAYRHQTWCMGSLHQDAAWDCNPCVCNQGQGHCY